MSEILTTIVSICKSSSEVKVSEHQLIRKYHSFINGDQTLILTASKISNWIHASLHISRDNCREHDD